MALHSRFRTVLAVTLLASALQAGVTTAHGETELPGLQGAATVTRDTNGISHIRADSELDMVRLQGWVHARDRLFQMDLLRRQASGTLAELVGPAALAGDVESRTIGLRRAAVRSWDALSPQTRAALQAYSDGVNHFASPPNLPPEYGILGRGFDPWTPIDSLVIAKLLAFSLSFDLDIGPTLTMMAYTERLGMADGQALYFVDTHRAAPFTDASTVPDAGGASTTGLIGHGLLMANGLASIKPATVQLGRQYLDRVSGLSMFQSSLKPGYPEGGSNEWVVGGRFTVNGLPLLANDPHLDLTVPAIFYPIQLKAESDGFDVSGESFAGIPYVVLGQSRNLVWGATTNEMDVTDVYQEKVVFDVSSPSGLSTVYKGNNEHIQPLPQTFKYNDGAGNLITAPPGGMVGDVYIPPAVLIVPRRNEGPIVAIDLGKGLALSIQFTGFSPTREIDAFRSINLAGTIADFKSALAYMDFGSQNFSVADKQGNIAMVTSAELPLREDLQAGAVDGVPPFFIRNGEGGNEWLPATKYYPGQAIPYEILPPREMPGLLNPAKGYFVNANNDPLGTSLDNNPLNQLRPGIGLLYFNYTHDFGVRAKQIGRTLEQMLAAGPVDAEDMKALQANVRLLDAEVFMKFILNAANNAAARAHVEEDAAGLPVDEAIARLAAWDFSTPTGVDTGYDASDVDGVLEIASAAEIDHSVAATIYAVWRSRMIQNVIDQPLKDLFTGLPVAEEQIIPDEQAAMTALRNLLDNFDANQGVGVSGVDFFPVAGVTDAATRRDVLIMRSLVEALDLLRGPAFADAFHNSTNLGDYRWGRLHRLVMTHPFGGPFDIPPAFGAFPPSFPDLPGVAVDGGFAGIDRSNHALRAQDSNGFMFIRGAVRRYVGSVGRVDEDIAGQSSLPGGVSGNPFSPFYANLFASWLTNDTYPVLRSDADVAAHALDEEDFTP